MKGVGEEILDFEVIEVQQNLISMRKMEKVLLKL